METLEHADLELHRRALLGHCYRMVGSVVDAEDAVQETLVRAWRGRHRFEHRSRVRTWLHRIATNVCLDVLAERSRRTRPMELGPAGSVEDELVEREPSRWIEPVPETLVLPADSDPAELAILRQSIRLAFVAALQHLPPRQRAALLLADVLGWSAAEIADALNTSEPAVNSALQRARATLSRAAAFPEEAGEGASGLTAEEAELATRFAAAFERYDIDALAAMLRHDATFSMPPYDLWLQGPEAVKSWLTGRGTCCRGSRLVSTAANGHPAFGQYRQAESGGHRPWALTVIEIEEGLVCAWNSFLDTETLFPRFGLPEHLPA